MAPIRDPIALARAVTRKLGIPRQNREDITHDILVTYWNNPARNHFANNAYDALRKYTHRGKEHTISLYEPTVESYHSDGDDIQYIDVLPLEDFSEQVITSVDIMNAIFQLPDIYKDAILHYYYHGESIEHMSQERNITFHCMAFRLSRARRLLKKLLGKSYATE